MMSIRLLSVIFYVGHMHDTTSKTFVTGASVVLVWTVQNLDSGLWTEPSGLHS